MIPPSPTARKALVDLAAYEDATARYPVCPTMHPATRASLHAAGYLTSDEDYSCRLTGKGWIAVAEITGTGRAS